MLFRSGIFSNPAMNKAFLAGLGMQLAVLCLPPLQQIFQTVPLNPLEWGVVLLLAVTPVGVCEMEKFLRKGKKGKREKAEKDRRGSGSKRPLGI